MPTGSSQPRTCAAKQQDPLGFGIIETTGRMAVSFVAMWHIDGEGRDELGGPEAQALPCA